MYQESWGDEIHPIMEKLAQFTGCDDYCDQDTSASIDWIGESDDDESDGDEDVLFIAALEEDLGISLSDLDIERFFSGDMKIAELMEIQLSKEAKLSTPQEKARARTYRLQNAVSLKRKSKKRRKLLKSGIKRAQKRVGTAAGGYSFIPSAGAKSGGVPSMSSGSTGRPSSNMNFSPHASPKMSVMNSQSLNKMAAMVMPSNIAQAAAFNPSSPMAGMGGFPKPPDPITNIAPMVKVPNPRRPINFKKLLPKTMDKAIKQA
jgi:hypothetical protein